MPDITVMACNTITRTKYAREGAVCYVIYENPGSGSESMKLLIRSNSGRWIIKWERIWRLCNFRIKTIPEENPLQDRLVNCYAHRLAEHWQECAAFFNWKSESERQKRATSRVYQMAGIVPPPFGDR